MAKKITVAAKDIANVQAYIRDIAIGASMAGKYEGVAAMQSRHWTGVWMEYEARAKLAELGLYDGDADAYRAIAADAAKFVREGIV